jgi:Common central domain of tyrosinase/Polyphenol oxidase middle domain
MPFDPRAASLSTFRLRCAHRHRSLLLAWAVLFLCPVAKGEITINKNLPISNPANGAVYLSPPEIEPANECSARVKVTSFVPGATIHVYLTATLTGPLSVKKLIGGPIALPLDGLTVPLTQHLNYGDQVKATQTVNSATSALSAPMTAGPMLTSLPKPAVDGKNIYACGVVAPVYNLVSGVTVEVFDKTAGGTTPIGTGSTPNDWGSDWAPVGTGSLVATHEIWAKQSACNGAKSDFGPFVPVQPDPSPFNQPKVESAIIGDNAITLDGLFTGAIVQIFDDGTGVPLNGTSAATGATNYFLLPTPLSAAKVNPQQTLCQPDTGKKQTTTTTSIPRPVLLGPICQGDSAVTVRKSTVNAALVLLLNTSIAGYGGAALGDVPLDIAPPAVFNDGDTVQVAEYFTSLTSPPVVKSNIITVGCKVHVRQDVANLTAAQITSLKRGFQVMMQRSFDNPNDPTGFTYQANIHSTVTMRGMCLMGDPSNPLWDQCQHYSDLFFPWHRMYLYYFERILRAASGDPNLTLPYWNYESSSEQTLPPAFLTPTNSCNQVTGDAMSGFVFHLGNPSAHPGCNPLYLPDRIMDGSPAPALASGAASDSTGLSDIDFEASFGGAFGGGPPPGSPPRACHFDSNQGDLESQPHDVIHTQVGGIMASTETSANDPIFYLHHTEIDHLWKVWLAQGGGRANPTSDSAWMNTSFSFYDETGSLVSRSVKDALDTVAQLDYRYDDDPPAQQKRQAPREEATQQFPPTPSEQLAADTQTGIGLTSETIRTQLNISPENLAKINHLLDDKEFKHAIVLNLDIDHVNDLSGVYYEVYANLPAGDKPSRESIYYLGNLGFFVPKGSGVTKRLDLTRPIRAMRDKKVWDGSQLTISFVPRGVVDSKTKQPLPLQPGVRATVERVSVVAR